MDEFSSLILHISCCFRYQLNNKCLRFIQYIKQNHRHGRNLPKWDWLFCRGAWGSWNRSSPRSLIGLIAIILPPRFDTSPKVANIRGGLVPGLCLKLKIASARSKSSSVTVPLPKPIESVSPTLVVSWHILEQSGKLRQHLLCWICSIALMHSGISKRLSLDDRLIHKAQLIHWFGGV